MNRLCHSRHIRIGRMGKKQSFNLAGQFPGMGCPPLDQELRSQRAVLDAVQPVHDARAGCCAGQVAQVPPAVMDDVAHGACSLWYCTMRKPLFGYGRPSIPMFHRISGFEKRIRPISNQCGSNHPPAQASCSSWSAAFLYLIAWRNRSYPPVPPQSSGGQARSPAMQPTRRARSEPSFPGRRSPSAILLAHVVKRIGPVVRQGPLKPDY